jgi:hypothetical protein
MEIIKYFSKFNYKFVVSLIYTAVLLFIAVLGATDIRKLSRRINVMEKTISKNQLKT